MRLRATIGTWLIALPCAAQAPTRWDLRQEIDTASKDGVSALELKLLSARAFELAEAAQSRAEFWGAISLTAELCGKAPLTEARGVRARSLELLTTRSSDAMRWSSLLTRQFVPDFEQCSRERWGAELAEYDRVLDTLSEASDTDLVRAELAHAKAFARVFINRRWPWLTETARLEALDMLRDLQSRFGDRPLPGASDPSQTVGARAGGHIFELQHLYFGAPAPATSGVDLEGRPLDIADYRGKVVVLDFWTSFCSPCLAMVPTVCEMLTKLDPESVVYLGINGDRTRAEGQATAQRVGMTWRNLWDGPEGPVGPVASTWRVAERGWPSVFVLDRKGRIRAKLCGKEQIEAQMPGAIRALLPTR